MSKLIEEWKPVVGYEDRYEVSDWGNVKSLDYYYQGRNQYGSVFTGHKKGRILKQTFDKDGYLMVCLHNNEGQTTKGVHKLVAKAWIPNPENKPIVGHLKTLENGLEDKTANEVWNLAWMTVAENNTYGTLQERQRISHSGDKCYNYGKHLSDEIKKKISEAGKRYAIKRARNKEGRFCKQYETNTEENSE